MSRIGSSLRILVTGVDSGTRSTAALRAASASWRISPASGSTLGAVIGE